MVDERRKTTIRRLWQTKAEGRRIAALGVYDAPMAAIADRLGFDVLMIGNSGPMSLFGYRESTQVRRDDLFYMTRAVSRVARYGLVVATMPYMSYLVSREEAIRTAAWIVSEAGAEAAQCHGDRDSAANISAIIRAGVPVLAHLGLQSVRKTAQSGFRVQGNTAASARVIVEDALALTEAGVFAFVLELVPAELCGYLRRLLPVPVLSLGSGPDADGIYQVSGDVVGFSAFPRPRTAAQFADARGTIDATLRKFFNDVRSRAFPGHGSQRNMPPAEYGRLMEMLRT